MLRAAIPYLEVIEKNRDEGTLNRTHAIHLEIMCMIYNICEGIRKGEHPSVDKDFMDSLFKEYGLKPPKQ